MPYPIPMKLTDVGTDVEPYLTDPNWIMQQKHDGARMLAIYRTHEEGLVFVNGAGSVMTFAAAVLKFDALRAELLAWITDHRLESVVLDGEIIVDTGVYHVFDIVEASAAPGTTLVRPDDSLAYRHATLEAFADGELIRRAVTAKTEPEKRALWAAINDSSVEGAVSKHLASSWVDSGNPKKPYRTPQWVKHKLVKTADVVVTSVDRTFKADGVTLSHGKAELAVPIEPWQDPQPFIDLKGKRYTREAWRALTDAQHARLLPAEEPRALLPVGNASLIGKELTIDVGSVVEVAYLNFQDAMVQPRIIRQRFDKPAEACDLAQFPAYTRAVVTL